MAVSLCISCLFVWSVCKQLLGVKLASDQSHVWSQKQTSSEGLLEVNGCSSLKNTGCKQAAKESNKGYKQQLGEFSQTLTKCALVSVSVLVCTDLLSMVVHLSTLQTAVLFNLSSTFFIQFSFFCTWII